MGDGAVLRYGPVALAQRLLDPLCCDARLLRLHCILHLAPLPPHQHLGPNSHHPPNPSALTEAGSARSGVGA